MTGKSISIIPLDAHASIVDAFGIDITLFTDVHWKKENNEINLQIEKFVFTF